MADLTITVCRLVRATESEILTKPAGEVATPGTYMRQNTTTGYLEKGNASSEAELGGVYGLLIDDDAAVNQPSTIALPGAIVDLGSALDSLAYDAPVFASATDGLLADAAVDTNEVQTVTITGSPTGGTFTLTFGGQTTGAIAYNAAASAVQTALEALSTIGVGNVVVSGSAGGPYTVNFVNDLGNTNVAAMTASGASLTGGTSPGVTIATATAGVQGRVVGRVIVGLASTGGDRLLRLV
jgi:hypothetical protein